MTDRYESPLSSRYASEYMLHLFSQDVRYQTWRKLWVSLARAEHKLGLGITEEQVKELEAHITDIDYAVAAEREKLVRHDVMSHVYAYGLQCPKAKALWDQCPQLADRPSPLRRRKGKNSQQEKQRQTCQCHHVG